MGKIFKGITIMPELPEVFTISENLKEILPNSSLEKVDIIEKYRSIPDLTDFSQIINQRVKDVSRVSKYILINFENSKTLLIHLGMTGRIRFAKVPQEFGWDKIILTFKNSNQEEFQINFTDTRKFGKVKILSEVNIDSGKEVFNLNEQEKENLINLISKKNTEIKNILLDQKIISGLGNIYSNDTLFDAKINPSKKGTELSKVEIEKILMSAKKILEKGIEKKGSSLKDKMYTDIYGNFGKYQDYFLVYGKEFCPDCQKKLNKIYIKQRSSFYCSTCQVF